MSFKAGNKDSPANLGKSPHESTAWFHIVGPCTFCKKSPYDWPFTPPKKHQAIKQFDMQCFRYFRSFGFTKSPIYQKKTPCLKKVQFLKIFLTCAEGKARRATQKKGFQTNGPLWWENPRLLQAISSRYGSTRQRNEPKLGVLGTFFLGGKRSVFWQKPLVILASSWTQRRFFFFRWFKGDCCCCCCCLKRFKPRNQAETPKVCGSFHHPWGMDGSLIGQGTSDRFFFFFEKL